MQGQYRLPLIEPVPIEDDYCGELVDIEDIGGAARFILATEHTCYEAGTTVLILRRKIVLPYRAIRPGAEMALRFVGHQSARVLFGNFATVHRLANRA